MKTVCIRSIMFVILFISFHFREAVILYIWCHTSAQQIHKLKTLFHSPRSSHNKVVILLVEMQSLKKHTEACNVFFNDLMIFLPPLKKNPCQTNSQSLLLFQYYCSLLNSVCSQHSMEDVTTVTALDGDTLIEIFKLGFFSPLKVLGGDEEKPAISSPLSRRIWSQSWLFEV